MVTPTTLISGGVAAGACGAVGCAKKSNALLLADCATKFVCIGIGVSAGALGGATTSQIAWLNCHTNQKIAANSNQGYSFTTTAIGTNFPVVVLPLNEGRWMAFIISAIIATSLITHTGQRLANGHHHTVISPFALVRWHIFEQSLGQ